MEYIHELFKYHPELIFNLAMACVVSLCLRSAHGGLRRKASMATYLGLCLAGNLSRNSLTAHFIHVLIELFLVTLPSAVVAFGVLQMLQYATSPKRASPLNPSWRRPEAALPEDGETAPTPD